MDVAHFLWKIIAHNVPGCMRRFGGPDKQMRSICRPDKLWVEWAVGRSNATDLGERNPGAAEGGGAHTDLLYAVRYSSLSYLPPTFYLLSLTPFPYLLPPFTWPPILSIYSPIHYFYHHHCLWHYSVYIPSPTIFSIIFYSYIQSISVPNSGCRFYHNQ
jgi:hypothetical protein